MRGQLYHGHVNVIALLLSSGSLSTTRAQHLYEIGVTHQAEKIGLETVRPTVQGATFSMRGQLHCWHYLSHYVLEGLGRKAMRRRDCVRNWIPHQCAPRDTGRRPWSTHTRVSNLSAAYRWYTVRHYTRATCGLVDVKARKQMISNQRFEREIKLVRL